MSLFSVRHRRSLADGQLDVTVDGRLRRRIVRLLRRFNESWHYQPDPGDNWTERTDALSELVGDLLDVYGGEKLWIKKGNVTTVANAETWILEGPDEGVLDSVEQYLTYVSEERRLEIAAEINRIFSEEDSVWRLLDQQFVKLDSIFVHQQVIARAHERLGAVRWEGAAEELLAAEHDLTDCAGRRAVHHAGNSTESAMKAALGRDDGSALVLARNMAELGWFDDLAESMRAGFVDNVLGALPWMRNRLGGHGQGPQPKPVPDPYARLAVGLSAVINEFIVALALARDPSIAARTDAPNPPVSASSADDDIPF